MTPRRVCLVKSPELQGVLVQAGPEQSIVKWDNGNVDTVVNYWIKFIDDEGGELPSPALIEVSAAIKVAPPPDGLSDEIKSRYGSAAELKTFALNNGVWAEAYDKLPNSGLVRMGVLNRLRAKVRKGHVVVYK